MLHCASRRVTSTSFMGALVSAVCSHHSRMWLKAQQRRVNVPTGHRAASASVLPMVTFTAAHKIKSGQKCSSIIAWPQNAPKNRITGEWDSPMSPFAVCVRQICNQLLKQSAQRLWLYKTSHSSFFNMWPVHTADRGKRNVMFYTLFFLIVN